jgi:DNA-binding NarL/FixJ family response regulator
MRALICDDDAALRRVIRAILQSAGVEVVGEAGNTVEALTLLRAAEPDLLILDVGLPVVSGLEALPLIVERAPRCKVVLFTAYDVPREEVVALGAYDVLYKPTGINALADVVLGLHSTTAPA